ncbi:MAG: Hsp20/alpha crystallin family protein [Haloglomus sp.]
MTDPRHELELYREDENYLVLAHVDAEPEDIDVQWVDGHLHVAAEHHHEGRTRVTHRDMTFPRAVDSDGITADYDAADGVLEIRLPIGGDRPEEHSITVGTAE